MAASQSTDLAIALCENLVNRLLESITTYSVTIFLHLFNLLVICWEIKHTCVEQFAPIAEAFQMVCHLKKPKWKHYERVNRNFIAMETWSHQFGKTQFVFWALNRIQLATKQWTGNNVMELLFKFPLSLPPSRTTRTWEVLTWTTSKEIIMLWAANRASGGVICCGFSSMWALSMVTFWKLQRKIIALDHNCSFASSWQRRLSGNLVRLHLVFRKGAWLVDTGL